MSADNSTLATKETVTGVLDRYPGIRPFSKSQSILFYGRNAELNELLNSVKAYNLFVLHSKSGLGKTSLLNAGLMPMLEREGFLPIEIRFRFTNISKDNTIEIPDPFQVIEEACKEVAIGSAIAAIKPQYKTLWIYMKLMEDRHKIPVLVLDQFEEFFSHPDKERKEQIIMQFAELLNDRPPAYVYDFVKDHKDLVGDDATFFLEPCSAHILISIRSDKLALLDEMKTLIPSITNKRFQLNPLFAAQAKQAILLPASLINFGNRHFRKAPFEYDIKALETILKVLQDKTNAAEIESTQLQIICQSIEKKIPDAGNGNEEIIVTEETFDGEEGLRRILKNFYDTQLAALAEMEGITIYDIERVRDMIETKMIFEEMRVGLLKKQVINYLVDFETLKDENERTKKAELIISTLTDLRIIRSEETYLGTTYVITHDTLIGPITESHKQDIERKERSAQQAFTDVTDRIESSPGIDDSKAIEFFAEKMILDGKSKPLTEREIIEGLSVAGLDGAQAKRLVGYATRENFFRPGQTDCDVTYQLSNERLVDLVEKDYITRKTIRDNLRLKEEKEQLEKLTAEKDAAMKKNRKLSNIIGLGIMLLLIALGFLSSYFRDQSNANKKILAKNINYEAERSYAAGYQVLAYALWKQALEYTPGDTVIRNNLFGNEYYPYQGANIDVSDDQQYIATRNGNRLSIWKDSGNSTTLVMSEANIEEYSFIPNTQNIYLLDTAGRVRLFDLAARSFLPLKSEALDLDVSRVRQDISDVKILPLGIRVYMGSPSYLYYLWNFQGKYLDSITTFCNTIDTIGNLSSSSTYMLNENELMLERVGVFYLLDFKNDHVTKLGLYEKGLSLKSITKLSSNLYTMDLEDYYSAKKKVLVFNLANRKIIYRSSNHVNAPFVTPTRIVYTDKGLKIFNFIDSTSSTIPFPAIDSYRTSVFDRETIAFFKEDASDVKKLDLFVLSPKNELTRKDILLPDSLSRSIVSIGAKENFIVYETSKGNVYSYDIKKAANTLLAKNANDFIIQNGFVRIYSDVDYYVDARDGKIITYLPTAINILYPKFLKQSDGNYRLIYLDSTKNNIDSLQIRYKSFIDQRFDSLGLPKRKPR